MKQGLFLPSTPNNGNDAKKHRNAFKMATDMFELSERKINLNIGKTNGVDMHISGKFLPFISTPQVEKFKNTKC